MIFQFKPFFNGLPALHHAPDLKRCEGCSLPMNWADAHWDMFAKPKSLQISTTTDGFTLASPAFKARYEREGWIGLTFRPLSNDYFDVRASRSVKLCHNVTHGPQPWDEGSLQLAIENDESVQINVHRSHSCPTCGRYQHSLGGGAVTIARGEVPVAENEFVAGETLIWDGDRVSVDIIVGQAIRDSHYEKRFARCSVYSKAHYQSWSSDVA